MFTWLENRTQTPPIKCSTELPDLFFIALADVNYLKVLEKLFAKTPLKIAFSKKLFYFDRCEKTLIYSKTMHNAVILLKFKTAFSRNTSIFSEKIDYF